MRTLIIYASTYGFTKECVEDLKQNIRGEVIVSNITRDKLVPSINEFDNIVIGGSIYMGQINKKLKVFCQQNLTLLIKKRVALFLSCGLPENFNQSLNNAFPNELIEIAIAKECLGGELRIEKMSIPHKLITNLMKKAQAKEGKADPIKIPLNIKKLTEVINS